MDSSVNEAMTKMLPLAQESSRAELCAGSIGWIENIPDLCGGPHFGSSDNRERLWNLEIGSSWRNRGLELGGGAKAHII